MAQPRPAETFTLTGDGTWQTAPSQAQHAADAAARGDRVLIDEARRLIAAENHKAAERILDDFITRYDRTASPWLPEAVLLLGDAKLGQRDEYDALFEYERVIREFPGSAAFPVAVERQLEIATMYLNGLKRKFLGLRIESTRLLGEELLIRTQERMPGSVLAEEAAIRLADHYYDRRDLTLAAEMYDIFLENHPESSRVPTARSRRIFANIGRFKGPAYDGGSLLEASALIESFARTSPAEAERAGITQSLATRVNESAAMQLLADARWYLRRNDDPSARFVLQRLLRTHPTTNAAQAAMRTLEERGWLPDRGEAVGVEEGPAEPKPQKPETGTETAEPAGPTEPLEAGQ